MRCITLIMTALILSACNMSEMASKILPDTIEAMAHRDIDAILAGDAGVLKDLQTDETDEDFSQIIDKALAQRSPGPEMSRHIVGANSSTSISASDGTNARHAVIYEVQTEGGFTAIELTYVQTPEDKTCCRLGAVTINRHDASPYMDGILAMERASKIAGIAIVIIIALLIAGLLFWRARRSGRAGRA